ncbi:hypothetical protein [uncultured Nostoc sp.]|uniref:hypothetical protein n=1 Tax=uncultured Nostoc sp. TaxID=340711 RepID=UPI0035CAB289
MPVSIAANLTHFCEKYLEDGFTKYIINERVAETFNLVSEEKYSSVTVLGHSFGAIIGTKLLAELPEKQNVNFITLGSTLKFFSFKSHPINSELSKLVEGCKGKVEKWIEYYAEEDPVCIKWLPVGKYDNLEIKTIDNLEIKTIPLYNARGKKIKKMSFASITGQSHLFYFYNQELLQKILFLK